MEIHRAVHRNEKNMDALIQSLDGKMERLVEHLIKKADPRFVPVSVFGWLVAFLLIFNFALVFGIPATERLAQKLTGTFAEDKEPEK